MNEDGAGGKALWTWAQCNLALGLVESWIRAGSAGPQRAEALLEGMSFFEIQNFLVEEGRPAALVAMVIRFVAVASSFGEPFFGYFPLSQQAPFPAVHLWKKIPARPLYDVLKGIS